MNNLNKISATIVLYKNNKNILQNTIDSFLKTPLSKKLFLVDNSPTNKLAFLANHKDIEYIFIGKNIGFGKAHNKVLSKLNSNFHLVLNPDVSFSSEVIPSLIKKLALEANVAMIAPKVVFPNGKHQYSVRKHPKPIDLIIRRLNINKKRIFNQEYRNKDLSKPFYPDCISGCFMLFKTADFIQIKGFDKRYFMYLEDFDICKKIDFLGKKKLYFPEEKIVHIHQKGSAKKVRLFLYHLSSAFKYFNKWGWK